MKLSYDFTLHFEVTTEDVGELEEPAIRNGEGLLEERLTSAVQDVVQAWLEEMGVDMDDRADSDEEIHVSLDVSDATPPPKRICRQLRNSRGQFVRTRPTKEGFPYGRKYVIILP